MLQIDDDIGNRKDTPTDVKAPAESVVAPFWRAPAGLPAGRMPGEVLSDLSDHDLAARFNRLTPDQILASVESLGVRATGRFIILNSFENRVYQLELEDDGWVVGKFYRPGRWSRRTILAEHRFLRDLRAEEIPVIAPLELVSGETLGEIEGIFYCFYPRVGGRSPDELNDEQLRIIGRLLARIHNVGACADESHRVKLDVTTYGWANLAWLMDNDVVPTEVRAIFADTVRVLLERIAPMFAPVPMHRIHGDCHVGNLIDGPEGLTFLDFDDMVIGPAVQDVWMLVPSFDEHGRAQRETLLEAYSEFRSFSPSWLRLVEPLRALRFLRYATWVARRFHDPIFQSTFNHFGTLLYWQREVQDLREQIARLDMADELRVTSLPR